MCIFFMFSECAQTFGNLVRNQGPNSPDKRGSKTLDESRISHITIGIKAFRATPNIMIQRMAIAQQPDPIDVNLRQAQTVSNLKTSLHQVQSFLGQLPKDRTNEVMPEFIPAVKTAEHARKQN